MPLPLRLSVAPKSRRWGGRNVDAGRSAASPQSGRVSCGPHLFHSLFYHVHGNFSRAGALIDMQRVRRCGRKAA
ncbi:hypothetical protein EDF59_101473 [Novosphingobium sp. ST904]|nr:hypothetical protein EDF59_101473 [Novosphingobium sp. ST904]